MWIVGEPNPRGGIELVRLHASVRHSIHPALDQSVGDGGIQVIQVDGNCLVLVPQQSLLVNLEKVRGYIRRRIPVPGLVIFLMVVAKEAEADARVYRQALADFPIVLNVRLHDVVAVVVFPLRTVLLVGSDVAQQHVGVLVSRHTVRAEIAEVQHSLQLPGIGAVGCVDLVPLSQNQLHAKLYVVLANHLADVVPQAVGRVLELPGRVAGIDLEPAAVRQVPGCELNAGQLAAEVVVEQVSLVQAIGTLDVDSRRWPRRQADMRSGVTQHHFIQQRGRDGVGQAGHGACPRAKQAPLDGWKAVADRAPDRPCLGCVPRVMNVAERCAQFAGLDLVVDAEQLLPPVRGLGESEVVAGPHCGIASARGVGQRNHPRIEHGLRRGVDREIAVRAGKVAVVVSHDVERIGRPVMSGTVGELRGIEQRGDLTTRNHRAHIAEIRANIRIAVRVGPQRRALDQRRYCLIEVVVGGVFFEAELLGEKKESPVFVGIDFWNRDWPAQREPEIILAKLGRSKRLVEIIPGVQIFVAQKIIGAAVQRTAARLRVHQNGARSAASVLRAIVRGQNLQFVDRVQAGINHQRALAAVNAGVQDVRPVHAEGVVFHPAAIDAELHAAFHAHQRFILASLVADARCEGQGGCEVTAVESDLGKFLGGDRA